jgi:C-terminal novel E3 ligase, LRR-interacting
MFRALRHHRNRQGVPLTPIATNQPPAEHTATAATTSPTPTDGATNASSAPFLNRHDAANAAALHNSFSSGHRLPTPAQTRRCSSAHRATDRITNTVKSMADPKHAAFNEARQHVASWFVETNSSQDIAGQWQEHRKEPHAQGFLKMLQGLYSLPKVERDHLRHGMQDLLTSAAHNPVLRKACFTIAADHTYHPETTSGAGACLLTYHQLRQHMRVTRAQTPQELLYLGVAHWRSSHLDHLVDEHIEQRATKGSAVQATRDELRWQARIELEKYAGYDTTSLTSCHRRAATI